MAKSKKQRESGSMKATKKSTQRAETVAQEGTLTANQQKFPRNPDGSFSAASDKLARMLVMEGASLIRPFD